MLEKAIVEFCSPTLAGLKTAGMFGYPFQSERKLFEELEEANRKLNGKGVFIEVLKTKDSRALVYVYRRDRLAADLEEGEAVTLLDHMGYVHGFGWRGYLEQMKSRLEEYDCFPHEIGLFLGYPICDVIGFIEHKGRNYKCAGLWKSYGDETEMTKVFRKLKKCRKVYGKLFSEGKSIMQLTVAA